MNCEKTKTTRRGDYIVHEIVDLTRVGHPKFADVVEAKEGFMVVPVNPENPVVTRDTVDEVMSFCNSFLRSEK